MAKKRVPEERKRTQKKKNNSPEESNKTPVSKSQSKNNTKAKNSTSIITKNKSKTEDKKNNKIRKSDLSSEETEGLVAPSSSTELENGDVVESDGEEVAERYPSVEENEEDKETLISIKRKGKKDVVKNKGKKRGREEDESEAEDTAENSLYTFPMNRISRIIKSENPDIRILKEAVFVINRASEKFLQAFCREAYAHAFLENKKHTAYEHLSTIVSKRKRLNFLADFVPEKVKAEDALAQLAEDKQ